MDVHYDALDAAVRPNGTLGVTLANAREAIDLVARQCVAATTHALDGDRIVAKSGDEAVLLGRRVGAAGGEREECEDESLHITGVSGAWRTFTIDRSDSSRKRLFDEGTKRMDARPTIRSC
jgi:hypothetical protein